jgi:hypothetical protein
MRQSPCRVAPGLGVVYPLRHGRHVDAPAAVPNVPSGHRSQLLLPAVGAYCPAGQGVHCVKPSMYEKVPGGQGVHRNSSDWVRIE